METFSGKLGILQKAVLQSSCTRVAVKIIERGLRRSLFLAELQIYNLELSNWVYCIMMKKVARVSWFSIA